MLETIQYLSIIIEAIVAILGFMIFFQKKKKYGIGIFLTFAIYVFYDFSNITSYSLSSDVLYVLFFIATLSMLVSVWMIYKEKKR